MLTHNNTILNKNANVNNFKDFIDDLINDDDLLNSLIEKDLKKESFNEFIAEHNENNLGLPLYRLIPEIHKSFVSWIIKNQFNGNEEEYKKTIPLFFKLFSIKDKNICDNEIVNVDLSGRRKEKKRKKHLILYSAQLLKLIGKGRSKIATKAMVSSYRDEMKEQDDYLKSFRLINAQGKISNLVSNEQKQKQKMAQILKISKCFEDIAKDRKFTFSFITLTLPSSYHCLPLNGNTSSYDGKTPAQAIEQLNTYWKLIRARLSNLGLIFGESLFGIQVMECQTDSTLHLHCCLWHSKENTKDIHDEINAVAEGSAEKVNFDIKLDNGKAKASTYLFKYVLKTHSTYSDENKNDGAIKNMTARNLYGIRSFNFFGLKGSITKFNYLCKHYLNYKNELSKEIISCFENGDMYDFVTNYQEYFENSYIKENGVKKLLGVIFKKGQYENDCKELKHVNIIKNNEIVFIKNIQFCVFEKTYEEEFKHIKEMDLSDIQFGNVSMSFDKVCLKQGLYDSEINKVIKNNGYIKPSLITFSVQLYNIIQEKPEKQKEKNKNALKEDIESQKLQIKTEKTKDKYLN